MTIKSMQDISEEYEKSREELDKAIYVDGDFIILNLTASEYTIPISHCNNYKSILAWTFHLTEKIWMNRDLIRHFIKVACAASNIAIPSVIN